MGVLSEKASRNTNSMAPSQCSQAERSLTWVHIVIHRCPSGTALTYFQASNGLQVFNTSSWGMRTRVSGYIPTHCILSGDDGMSNECHLFNLSNGSIRFSGRLYGHKSSSPPVPIESETFPPPDQRGRARSRGWPPDRPATYQLLW